jgi:hypothetical protein
MNNINEYIKEEFFIKFKNSDIAINIEKDFDVLTWEKNFNYPNDLTPRERFGNKNFVTSFSMVPFYYINYLLEKSPETIYDLGCGWNIFKKYIPNIVGIGAELPESTYYHADIPDIVDDDFICGHQDYFDSVFSINALHFTSLYNLRKVVSDFSSMIKKNGRGFLALNLMRMIERTDLKILDNSFDYDSYIREELSLLSHNYLVFDIDLTMKDDSMDGNIRLVIEK